MRRMMRMMGESEREDAWREMEQTHAQTDGQMDGRSLQAENKERKGENWRQQLADSMAKKKKKS